MIEVQEKPPQFEEAVLNVDGMTCASCVSHVQKAANRAPGVQVADVNLARGRAVVRFDPQITTAESVAAAITDAGYPSTPHSGLEGGHDHAHHAHETWLNRAIAAILLWFPVEATHWILQLIRGSPHHTQVDWMTWTALVTSTIAIVYVGWGFYRSAFKALMRFTTNMDTLIAMGATVAWGYSAIALLGYLAAWWQNLPHLYFMESTGLLALVSLGHWLEARARHSAGSAIRELLELAPATALRLDNENPIEISVGELKIGDTILVRPGDRVPIDGQVIKGPSSVDESMITGESLPVTRDAGDTVIGGTQNIDGRLIVRVTKTGSDTALAQIIKLVEHAQASKPAIQRLADQIAAVFVPSVLSIALLTGIGWYIWGRVHSWDAATTWGQIALTVCSVLIIACPCALGLAIPAALMVGTGRGAKKGILIRDIDALQNAEKIDTVVLDKTGTITRGKPAVHHIESINGWSQEKILQFTAAAEQYSEHPLARAIVESAKQRGLNLPEPDSFTNQPGQGIIANVDGQTLLVGNEALVRRDMDVWPVPDAGVTLVYIALDRNGSIEPIGSIALVDQIKPDSSRAIRSLHDLKLLTVLLTGDNRATADQIARQVGIDDVRAQIKPDGKAEVIQELQNQRHKVAMVGDGINDAPALAQADLGIAIGSGSDIAKETGDIVLVGGSLHGIAAALRLSRATMRVIRQNLFFAFIYNVLAIPLAATGYLNPYIAAAAMALSDVTVIGNALRLRHAKID